MRYVSINLLFSFGAFLLFKVEEAPQFDNVFVALGSFHVEMSYFGTIGKYIAESGGPICWRSVIKSSLTSFLSGKSYKRSKRIHQLLVLAMGVIHFKFFQTLDEDNLLATEELQGFIVTAKLKIENNKTDVPTGVDDILQWYEAFSEDIRSEKHSKTAQYWMYYIEMIHL